MFAEQWSKVLVALLAPIVVISASGLLCLAFYNRLAAIVARLRAVQRERLGQQSACEAAAARGDGAAVTDHRRLLDNLALQTAGIIRRARIIRLTLFCLLATVALMVASSLMNGLALLAPRAAIVAAILFVSGMLCLGTAMIAAMVELHASLDVVELESGLVSELADARPDTTSEVIVAPGVNASQQV